MTNECLIAARPAGERVLADTLFFTEVGLTRKPGTPLFRIHWRRPSRTQKGVVGSAAMSAGAGPGVILRACDHAGTDRIPLHVAHGSPSVLLVEDTGERVSGSDYSDPK